MVFKICEGIPCSSFSVKELDVIVHKIYFPNITMLNLAILYPISLANLVVEVGTRHSHQTLLCSLLEVIRCVYVVSQYKMPYLYKIHVRHDIYD